MSIGARRVTSLYVYNNNMYARERRSVRASRRPLALLSARQCRYVCGEVSTLSLTPPESGSMDVIFESGSTATILTVPNTVKWPVWFDATSLEADTTYEILITDGAYGSVMTWAT